MRHRLDRDGRDGRQVSSTRIDCEHRLSLKVRRKLREFAVVLEFLKAVFRSVEPCGYGVDELAPIKPVLLARIADMTIEAVCRLGKSRYIALGSDEGDISEGRTARQSILTILELAGKPGKSR